MSSSARAVKVQVEKLDRFVAKRIAERSKVERLDTEYWMAITFENRAQVVAFSAWLGREFSGKYVNGVALAERLGVDIGERPTFPDDKPCSKRLAALASPTPPQK